MPYGGTYKVTSPVIAGYTANPKVVRGTMGSADAAVTVIYKADKHEEEMKPVIVPDVTYTYDIMAAPGIGGLGMNVGDGVD